MVTADGQLLYQREGEQERVLVAPWVAAEMTDLLQTAVALGVLTVSPIKAKWFKPVAEVLEPLRAVR